MSSIDSAAKVDCPTGAFTGGAFLCSFRRDAEKAFPRGKVPNTARRMRVIPAPQARTLPTDKTCYLVLPPAAPFLFIRKEMGERSVPKGNPLRMGFPFGILSHTRPKGPAGPFWISPWGACRSCIRRTRYPHYGIRPAHFSIIGKKKKEVFLPCKNALSGSSGKTGAQAEKTSSEYNIQQLEENVKRRLTGKKAFAISPSHAV